MSRAEIAEVLQAWFVENRGTRIDPLDDFIESGQMDSFDMLTMVAFCEQAFGISFSASDLESDRFVTLAGLTELIAAHLPG